MKIEKKPSLFEVQQYIYKKRCELEKSHNVPFPASQFDDKGDWTEEDIKLDKKLYEEEEILRKADDIISRYFYQEMK